MITANTIEYLESPQQNEDRLSVLKNIEYNELHALFNEGVENDPPIVPIDVKTLDLLNKKLKSKICTRVANFMGKRFFNRMMSSQKVIFKGVTGLQNLQGFSGAAMITCNHCHIFDNFAVYLALKQHFNHRKFILHKVVREGNYSYPGIIGFFLRNCNTLPVHESEKSMNVRVTAATSQAISTLLRQGKQILIYPEQAMWWNYKKPRPMKIGAFKFASKAKVPIIPLFITLKDSGIMGEDGFFVQEFTVNVLPIIYPDDTLDAQQNMSMMHQKNADLWKQTYESVYGIPLQYTTIVQ
ncbi:MAG: 1-acyl-sn-glycerol-3-phosphate acyltransferase [Clostridiales bacterium]|jgi:1-acyl-sn-glycerol-3-phosphate acyltransferase|nr:1-acyl-sn-glycerol-3-phosphate acyltransferase [Clostridiales bacterium]